MGIAVALILSMVVSCHAQFPGAGMASPKKVPAHKLDIPFIQCQVCDNIVRVMRNKVLAFRAESTKLTEAQIIDVLEQLCNPDTEAGEWITMLDLVEDGSKLNVIDTKQVGECDWECQTIARACNDILEDSDLSDFSQLLYKDVDSRAQLLNWLCFDESDVCRKKVPALPKDRPVGPKHKPLSESEISTQKVLRSMKAAGLSGNIMDRQAMKDELEQARAAGMLDNDDMLDPHEEQNAKSLETVKPGNVLKQASNAVSGWGKVWSKAKDNIQQATKVLASAVSSAFASSKAADSRGKTEL